jgi:hypothetical protein
MYGVRGARWGWGILLLLFVPMAGDAGGTYQSDIQRLKSWVKRDKTSLLTLDKLGQDLLRHYQRQQQQGEIYYFLAHQHAQGGLVFPQKVIDYATKALERPVTPDQKMRLYVYRGDALSVLDRKSPFAERRREAVASYLQGLYDVKGFQLPDTPPDVPNNPPKFLGPVGSAEATQQAFQKYEEEQRKYVQARERAEFTRKMMTHRKVLQGQIVAMYGRRPLATEELRSLATKTLGEGKELDRLMAAVGERVAKLPPEKTPRMVPIPVAPPVAAVPPEASSTYLYLGLGLGAGAVLTVALFLLARWWRAGRASAAKPAQ